MASPRASLAAAAAALLALTAPGVARGDDAPGGAPWFVPDHAKVQFAGTIGFLSAGVGYGLGGRRVGELDFLAGWVPARYVGNDLFTLTTKGTWQPWRARLGRRWELRPVTFALAVTYTRGDNLWLRTPDRYEAGYYDMPSALHASAALGGALSLRVPGPLDAVGIYWEVVATDVALFYWVKDRSAIDARDALSVALGLRVAR